MPREDGQPLARPSAPKGVELRSGSDQRSTEASSRGGESVQQTNPKRYPGARSRAPLPAEANTSHRQGQFECAQQNGREQETTAWPSLKQPTRPLTNTIADASV